MQNSKLCNRCRQWLPLDKFYKRIGGDGHQYRCKNCQRLNRNESRIGLPISGVGRSDDGTFKQPSHVECLICGEPAACSLDNPFWLNQYTDFMHNTYAALCGEPCFKRLGGIVVRMKHLVMLQRDKAA